MDALDAITGALGRWFDEQDRAALDDACRLAATTRFDLDALLRWLDEADAEEDPKDLAIRRMRATLGLRTIPGASCRPFAFGPDGRVRR